MMEDVIMASNLKNCGCLCQQQGLEMCLKIGSQWLVGVAPNVRGDAACMKLLHMNYFTTLLLTY